MSFLRQICTALAMAASLGTGTTADAEGLFAPAALVNDSVVTEFEIQQRQLFLSTLNSPAVSRDVILDALIDERIRAQEIENVGLEISQEAVDSGKAEFASRANMNVEEFVDALAANGVTEETFTDFVTIGIAWREYIGARFGPRLQVSEAEIDRALGSSSGASAIRVLISEIIIPAPEGRLAEVQALAEQIATSTSIDEFSAYAREYSATASRDQGGRLPWQALSNLPPVLRPLLLGLAPGDVTEPLTIPNAVALFQLRDIEETGAPDPKYAAIDYAAYYIAGGRTPAALKRAEEVRAQIDVCNDLYGVAQDEPPEVLERGSKPVAEIPDDIAFELSKLDPGESSVALTRANGQTLVFLMLCGRTEVANESVARADVAATLRSSRLNAFAESYLDKLRADARIRFP